MQSKRESVNIAGAMRINIKMLEVSQRMGMN
jgi:hypothetical protein